MAMTFDSCEIVCSGDRYKVRVSFVEAMEARVTLNILVDTKYTAHKLVKQLTNAHVEVYERQKLRGSGG